MSILKYAENQLLNPGVANPNWFLGRIGNKDVFSGNFITKNERKRPKYMKIIGFIIRVWVESRATRNITNPVILESINIVQI